MSERLCPSCAQPMFTFEEGECFPCTQADVDRLHRVLGWQRWPRVRCRVTLKAKDGR